MRYFLITILSLLFFSSFKTVQPEGVSDAQLVLSDSCRLSKIYHNGKILTIYHYDSIKNIIRIDGYGNYPKNRVGKITTYSEYKHDSLGRMIEYTDYQFKNQPDGKGAFNIWAKRNYIYTGDLITEVKHYTVNHKDKERRLILLYVDEHIYNSKNQLIKIISKSILKSKYSISKGLTYKKRRKAKENNWIEIDYDEYNNPVFMGHYTNIKKYKKPTLVKKIDLEYDSSPNLNATKAKQDFPVSVNNLVYCKVSDLKNEIWKAYNYQYDYQYNEQGLISNSQHTNYKSEINLFEYEYTCD